MKGIVGKIRIYPEKRAAGFELMEARLIEGHGLEGDCHAQGGERQISILFAESREMITSAKEKGLCFPRFNENITIEGMSSSQFAPGTRLYAGDAILEISSETKRCHKECGLYKNYEDGKNCPLAGINLFAKVVKGGLIRAGARISL